MQASRSSWLLDQPLIHKLLAAFGLVFLCFLATSAFGFLTFGRDAEARRGENLQLEANGAIKLAGQAVRQQQLAVRNFFFGDGAAALDGFREQARLRDQALARARELLADPATDARIEGIRATANQWDRDVEGFLKTQEQASQLSEEQQWRAGRRYLDSVANRDAADALLESLDQLYLSQVATMQRERDLLSAWVQRSSWVSLSLLLAGLLVILATVMLSARLIVRPVRTLTRQMGQLAEGELAIDIPWQRRRDEVGAIARAMEVFRQRLRASRDETWVKLGVGELASGLQTAASSEALARAAVSALASRVGAGVAVLFLWDEEARELRLAGSYGFQHRKHLGLRYALGEGLVGQAALERRRISLDQVPESFFGIHSALGEAPPRQVMAVPLVLKERLLGVFEFGTFQPFTAVQEAFVDEVLPDVALMLENMRAAEDTRLLLEKTQEQAQELRRSGEALRVHEEELRAANEELQAKTVELEEHAQRLAASEEELRVQAEELQASNEELRQKTDTLNEQKDVLQALQRETEMKAQALARASQYKSDFLANMSHELRTPLNSLLILSRELAENENGHLDHDEVEAARVIHDSGSNLLRLINDILDLSKIEAGKMDVYREEVRVDSVQRDVVRHFRHVALDKRLEFSVDVGADVPELLHTDRSKLQQILNNLLGNAFKFTREGQVRLHIGLADAASLARIGAPARSRWLAIAVSDTGIGIPQDRLESIFQAFEQVDSSTSRHFGGSGLGLAIARRLAQLLDGHLLADSEVDRGSVFRLLLPLAEAAAAAPAPAEPVPGAERAGGSVAGHPVALKALASTRLIDWIPDDRHTLAAGETLILTIEDDPVFARILVDLIRRKGHRALAAADGESGLELARRYRPTGILLDVMLPGMDGWTVMQQLKQDPVTAAIPVHFISAVDEAAKGVALGAVGYLTKPVDRKALIAAFDHLMEVAGKIVRKLLLVDDDADSRLALRSLLRADNLQIDEVASGEEALARIATQSYDCIVLDLNLGDISGLEFLERASGLIAVPPVVIYSGSDLSREESLKLRHYTDSIVIKGHRSPERLLDEVSLFLHSIQAPGAAPQPVDSGVEGRTALLVDDDMRNLFALSKALRARGMNVLMAQDGYKALQQLQENEAVELVLMDIMMPGMDGYQTIREIRADPRWSTLPIIAITAKAMQGDRDKCLEAGANDYLSKPVDLSKLLSMMRVWLQK